MYSFFFFRFGDKGCKALCEGLFYNKTLNHLSLCYCDFSSDSGMYLGELVSHSALRWAGQNQTEEESLLHFLCYYFTNFSFLSCRELLLDGNELEAEGTIALIQCLSDFAETEARLREEEALKKKAEKEQKALEAEKGDFGIYLD